ncbi:hypothetical protein QM565_14765 [Geitlerinema splendidum]|nr:hypothetical protein [Geitlerinema splendidum]
MFAVIHPKRCTQQSFTCDLLQTSFHCLGSSVTPAINRLSNQNVMQPSPRYVVFGCECSIFSLVLLHCIAPSWAGTPGSELISTMPEALEGVSQTFSDSIDEASEPAPATHFAIQQALQAGSQTAQQLIAVAPAPEELPALLWQQPRNRSNGSFRRAPRTQPSPCDRSRSGSRRTPCLAVAATRNRSNGGYRRAPRTQPSPCTGSLATPRTAPPKSSSAPSK